MQLEIDCYEWVLRKIDLNKIPFDRLERIIKTTIKDLERRKDKAMIRTDTEVVVAEEHGRPDFASMIDRIFEIKREMGISACYVDAANPEV